MENAAVYEGHARFTASHTVEVRDAILEADKIFINVGARATIPPVEGIGTVPYLTNSGMMDIDVLPEHLVIVGGGYIALEFGQMYRRFGSKVTIVQRSSRLLSKEDADVSTAVQEILENEGIQVCTNTSDLSVRNESGRIAVRLKCNDEAMEVAGSHLLVAAGRTPNTDDLGLDSAAIETDPRDFIQVDDQLRTKVEGVWALGECNGQGAFTHTAYNDFEIVAANLLDGDQRRVSDRIFAFGLFIDPPLGRVGLTEEEVLASGRKALKATRPMTRVGRAVEKGETQGFMKVLVDAETRQILGASILGVGGTKSSTISSTSCTSRLPTR